MTFSYITCPTCPKFSILSFSLTLQTYKIIKPKVLTLRKSQSTKCEQHTIFQHGIIDFNFLIDHRHFSGPFWRLLAHLFLRRHKRVSHIQRNQTIIQLNRLGHIAEHERFKLRIIAQNRHTLLTHLFYQLVVYYLYCLCSFVCSLRHHSYHLVFRDEVALFRVGTLGEETRQINLFFLIMLFHFVDSGQDYRALFWTVRLCLSFRTWWLCLRFRNTNNKNKKLAWVLRQIWMHCLWKAAG